MADSTATTDATEVKKETPEVTELEEGAEKMEIDDGAGAATPAESETPKTEESSEVLVEISDEEFSALMKAMDGSYRVKKEEVPEEKKEELKTETEPEKEPETAEKESEKPAEERSVQEMDADEFLEAANSILSTKTPDPPAQPEKPKKNPKERAQKPKPAPRPVILGEKVHPTVATVVNKMMRCKLEHEEMLSLAQRCNRPENIPTLYETEVNPSLWKQMPGGKRSPGRKLAFGVRNPKGEDDAEKRLQHLLVQGMSPVCYLMDSLYKVNEGEADVSSLDVRAMLAQATDAMAMLTRCYTRMNSNRRYKIASIFEDPHKGQYRKQFVSTKYLFDDSIDKACVSKDFFSKDAVKGSDDSGAQARSDPNRRKRKQGASNVGAGQAGQQSNGKPVQRNSRPVKTPRPDMRNRNSSGGYQQIRQRFGRPQSSPQRQRQSWGSTGSSFGQNQGYTDFSYSAGSGAGGQRFKEEYNRPGQGGFSQDNYQQSYSSNNNRGNNNYGGGFGSGSGGWKMNSF